MKLLPAIPILLLSLLKHLLVRIFFLLFHFFFPFIPKDLQEISIDLLFVLACLYDRQDIVEQILHLSPEALDLNDYLTKGITPLSLACRFGRPEIVRYLLKDGKVDVNKADHDGKTPLWIACKMKDVEIVRLLLRSQKVDVNKIGDSITPLHLVCSIGEMELIRCLLGYPGIHVNKETSRGQSAFYFACWKGTEEVVKVLLEDERVDVNQCSIDGNTPFMVACKADSFKEQKEKVKILLQDHRVDVSRANKEGETPLSFAFNQRKLEILKILLASGREMDLSRISLEGAPDGEQRGVHQLVEEFKRNPRRRAIQLRKELRWATRAGELLILGVFLCEGLLEIKDGKKESNAARFFKIFSQLHLDLQHVLINRTQGNPENSVSSHDIELALECLLESELQFYEKNKR